MGPSKYFKKWYRLADLYRGVEQEDDFRKAFEKGRQYEKEHGDWKKHINRSRALKYFLRGPDY